MTAILRHLKVDPLLLLILGLALILRLVGIPYGLSLGMVISDEPSLVLAALKMLELKSVIPALNPEVFASLLYYPPYLSYLYLAPFAAIAGTLLFLYEGPATLFSSYLLSDLSAFFIAARLISVVFGMLSIWLTYHIAKALFSSRGAALVSAFLMSTSILHIGLSVVARHWMPATFFFLLVLFFLTHTKLSEPRRYLYALLAAGIGMGISPILIVAPAMIGLWHIMKGTLSITELLTNRTVWMGVIGFLVLAIIPTLLHPGSSGFAGDQSFLASLMALDVVALLASPVAVIALQAFSEPVLILGAIVGLTLLLIHDRRLYLFFVLFFLGYSYLFFVAFRIEARFFLPLTPLYALLAGYAVSKAPTTTVYKGLIGIALLIALATSLRFAYLTSQPDTRAEAQIWMHEHADSSDKAVVALHLTRFRTSAVAVEELRAIAPQGVRRFDEADVALNRPYPHFLNIRTVPELVPGINEYAQVNGYQYLISDERFVGIPFAGTLVARFEGAPRFSLSDSTFSGSFLDLFRYSRLGPATEIRTLTSDR